MTEPGITMYVSPAPFPVAGWERSPEFYRQHPEAFHGFPDLLEALKNIDETGQWITRLVMASFSHAPWDFLLETWKQAAAVGTEPTIITHSPLGATVKENLATYRHLDCPELIQIDEAQGFPLLLKTITLAIPYAKEAYYGDTLHRFVLYSGLGDFRLEDDTIKKDISEAIGLTRGQGKNATINPYANDPDPDTANGLCKRITGTTSGLAKPTVEADFFDIDHIAAICIKHPTPEELESLAIATVSPVESILLPSRVLLTAVHEYLMDIHQPKVVTLPGHTLYIAR